MRKRTPPEPELTIICGLYSQTVPLPENSTVASVRIQYKDMMNIAAKSIAIVDGREADDDKVLKNGQTLQFVPITGEMGPLTD